MTRSALILLTATSLIAEAVDPASGLAATGATGLEEMVILGKAEDLRGIAASATLRFRGFCR